MEISLKEKLAGVYLLSCCPEVKGNLIAMATDEATETGAHAGNLIKALPNALAAAAEDVLIWLRPAVRIRQEFDEALAKVKEVLEGQIK